VWSSALVLCVLLALGSCVASDHALPTEWMIQDGSDGAAPGTSQVPAHDCSEAGQVSVIGPATAKDNATLRSILDALGLKPTDAGRPWPGDWQWHLEGGGVAYRSLRISWPSKDLGEAAQRHVLEATAAGLGLSPRIALRGSLGRNDTSAPAVVEQLVDGAVIATVVRLQAAGGSFDLQVGAAADIPAKAGLQPPADWRDRAQNATACAFQDGPSMAWTWVRPRLALDETPGLRLLWVVHGTSPCRQGVIPQFEADFDAYPGTLVGTGGSHIDLFQPCPAQP